MKNIYLSGLKKQSGKTTVIAGLLGTMQSLSYSTGYFKTIQSGMKSENCATDEIFIKNIDANIVTYTSYGFDSYECPLIGAYEAGITKISIPKIIKDYHSNIVETEFNIVEGTNSISTPIDDKSTEIQIVKNFDFPLVLVLNAKKDSIDEVISGINYIKSNNVKIEGIIINALDLNSDNIKEKYFPHLVNKYTGANIIGSFPYMENYDSVGADTLIAETLENFDVEKFFGLEIAKLKN